jgi:hypothetical protein
MDAVASKSGKVLKIVGIGLLIGISVISWVQAVSYQSKSKNMITCEGESSDTIIIVQERFRGRVYLDILKKMSFINEVCEKQGMYFGFINTFKLKSLFVNTYQRNVFYVFSFSTVP